MVKAFAGADTFILISMPFVGPRRRKAQTAAIDTAKKAGVNRIVYTSIAGAGEKDIDTYEVNGHVYTEAYGGFEKWGPLPYALPSNDVSYSAVCGDILLYNDSNIVIMIGNNSWSYTKLGHIENASRESLIAVLGEGDVEVALTI